MNNQERSQWIDNDEGLYNWWRAARISKTKFIQLNRAEIDAIIDRAVNPPHRHDWRCQSGDHGFCR